MNRICLKFIILAALLASLAILIKPQNAKAGIITGEKALGGASYYINKIIEEKTPELETEDIQLLAEVMYHENYVNGDKCMLYTGSVVINRVNRKRWPNTIRDVLYQTNPLQYATTGEFFTEEVPEEVYSIAKYLLIFGSVLPENVVYQAMHPLGSGIYDQIPSSYAPERDIEYFCYE